MKLKLPTRSDVTAAAKRIKPYVYETPIFRSRVLDEIAGANLIIKAECLQQTGSFKLRGATNRLLQIPEKKRAAGVVAFSSGNHAQGVARAAKRLGMPALIVMPTDAPQVKTDGVKADGAEVYLYDRNSESREEIAAEIARKRGAILVPSFDDPMIVAGQGTVGLEFAAQAKAHDIELDHLICCAGGGGLISGICLGLSGQSPDTQVWTAEPEGHDDWKRSLEAKTIVSNAPGTRSICDAILTPRPGDITWAVGSQYLVGGCVVTDEHAYEAMRLAFRQLRVVVEPGGAVALASALFRLPETAKGKTVGVVLTGGNVDSRLYAKVLSREV
ncbi:MAG: threonine/serine dehydratase [Henriciella sp.]|nr:threonine/serine dehydratase [Henriciella sp.]